MTLVTFSGSLESLRILKNRRGVVTTPEQRHNLMNVPDRWGCSAPPLTGKCLGKLWYMQSVNYCDYVDLEMESMKNAQKMFKTQVLNEDSMSSSVRRRAKKASWNEVHHDMPPSYL